MLIDPSNWSKQGYQIRPSVSAEGTRQVTPNLRLSARLGGFGQINGTGNGPVVIPHPSVGISERAALRYDFGKANIEIALMVEQFHNANGWNNDFATEESLSYQLHENLSVGASHQVISQLLDDSVGTFQASLGNKNRQNRLSLFLDFNF